MSNIHIVRVIDPNRFTPVIGVLIDGKEELRYDLEVEQPNKDQKAVMEKIRKDILEIVGEDRSEEVEQFFKDELMGKLTLRQYQEEAVKTAIYGEGSNIIYPTLGLTGEAGEVADKIKKVLRDEGGVFSDEIKQEIAKELGDVLWYLAALSRDLGVSLDEIAYGNLEKLRSRQERGVISGSGDNR